MSSHREAPEISKDPVADNTDVYAFVSPDRPATVTLIANFIPLQNPQGGPNFFEFGDDVLYEIHINNGGDAKPDVTYQFRFTTKIRNPNTFLYNTGPITNRRPDLQPAAVLLGDPGDPRRRLEGRSATGLAVPPVNVGIRSTPELRALHRSGDARAARRPASVFAGQRADGFFVDLGSIFDLGALRPFQNLHLIPSAAAAGVNGLQGLNVHTIAIQVPMTDLTRDGKNPTDVMDAEVGDRRVGVGQPAEDDGLATTAQPDRRPRSVAAGVPARQPAVQRGHRPDGAQGPVERPGPLDATASSRSTSPSPSSPACCRCCTRASSRTSRPTPSRRADLLAILLTGIPAGVVPGFQNFTGTDAGRPAAAQPGGPADGDPEPARAGGRRRRPASRTAAASSTTSSPSSCGPSPG